MLNRFAALLGSLALVALPACTEQVDCTTIGCDSQVVYNLGNAMGSRTYAIEACVDGDCTMVEVDVTADADMMVDTISVDRRSGEIVHRLPADREYGDAHDVSLQVIDDTGRIIADVRHDDVPFERSQPNGPRCEPVCWTARIDV